ncbi:carotenoid 1,2-hydratase [Enhygromyxa salina]|uniref:Acyclic carotenoid 1,2-hydratase n=1 Tax=Enhygromyxa salina TaxID=215803 RepID=A0A2S9YX10_9BACT|nr:carotenoid 1,2-hydratase [Enhygromyxa salina]PRQ09617.1 Acyclic carotenoid 1,2-hydratase [Enhygromyxa salina]
MIPDPTPLRFDTPVAPGGYAWWYLDGVSDDGALGFTIILFVGSVFSPRYARARARGPAADPEQHCAVNLAIYDAKQRTRVWALTEHGQFARDAEHLRVGASTIRWHDDGSLVVEIDERRTKFFGRRGAPLRGRVRLRPAAMFGPRVELDHWRAQPRHRWYPVAPHARVDFEFDQPALSFSGSGYHDVNEGDEALEAAFDSWSWSRCELGRESVILYDVVASNGVAHARAWRFNPADPAPTIEVIPETAFGPAQALATTRWGVARSIRSDPGHTPRLLHTLEDTPFYSRNLVEVQYGGRPATAVHESLSLRRFAAAWVRGLLPFKIATD